MECWERLGSKSRFFVTKLRFFDARFQPVCMDGNVNDAHLNDQMHARSFSPQFRRTFATRFSTLLEERGRALRGLGRRRAGPGSPPRAAAAFILLSSHRFNGANRLIIRRDLLGRTLIRHGEGEAAGG